MTASLLPPNSTDLERALDLTGARISAVDAPIDLMWNPETCPTAFLPWLAWSLSVDEWDNAWPEGTKRAVIAASVWVHRHKGTVGAVKRALAKAGYGDATVVERSGLQTYNGTMPRNGSRNRASQNHWAEYRVILARPVSVEQAERVRRILSAVAPARCHLKALDFQEALFLYNATLPRNGSYTRGIA